MLPNTWLRHNHVSIYSDPSTWLAITLEEPLKRVSMTLRLAEPILVDVDREQDALGTGTLSARLSLPAVLSPDRTQPGDEAALSCPSVLPCPEISPTRDARARSL